MKGWGWIGKWLLLMMLCGFSLKTGCSTASAAGANISIKTDTNPVVKGEIFYVMITVTSTEQMSGFEGYFSYNQGAMKYLTGGTVSSGNDDVFSISDTGRESGSKTLKYSIQFKARRSGSSTIELKEPYSAYLAETSEKMSVAYNTLNIRVLSKKEAQEQSLAVSGKTEDSLEEPEPEDGEESTEKNGQPAQGMPPEEDGQSAGEEPLEGTTPPEGQEPLGEEANGSGNGAEPLSLDLDGSTEAGNPVQDSIGQDSTSEETLLQGSFAQGSGQTQYDNTISVFGVTLNRQICILVIAIASIDLLLLGITFVKMRRLDLQEDDLEPDEDFDEEELLDEEYESRVSGGWRDRREIQYKPEESADIYAAAEETIQQDAKDIQQTMEDIEKRLEQKRRWLRKNN